MLTEIDSKISIAERPHEKSLSLVPRRKMYYLNNNIIRCAYYIESKKLGEWTG
jgi:hypothetical protein